MQEWGKLVSMLERGMAQQGSGTGGFGYSTPSVGTNTIGPGALQNATHQMLQFGKGRLGLSRDLHYLACQTHFQRVVWQMQLIDYHLQ